MEATACSRKSSGPPLGDLTPLSRTSVKCADLPFRVHPVHPVRRVGSGCRDESREDSAARSVDAAGGHDPFTGLTGDLGY
jgi:hypothetical protein